jgi:integrase
MPAKGDGITKRKDGLYMARYIVHTPEGPKRKTIYGRKYGEVEKKLAEARGDAACGIVFDAKGKTVGEFLERWLEDVVRPNKTHRTYATYRQQVRSHLIPALGRIKLELLRKAHVDGLYADLLRAKPQGLGLAPSSVRRVHAVLHAALEEAVRRDLIPRNPAVHANKPKVRQKEIEPLDAEESRTLLDAAKGDRYEALYVLCLMAGLRQGEALGLKWSDIDLDAGTLRVNRQLQRVRCDGDKSGTLVFSEPKNASRRTVGLPERAISALRRHRKRQLEEKLRAGAERREWGLVFANITGGPVEAQNVVNRYFKPLLVRAGLPPIRFQDLRHSCLSLLAQRGEPIRDLQALAGHATAAFTLQRYTHHYDASARRTADAMGDNFSDVP